MADRIKLRRGPKNKIDLNVYELGYITDSDEERLYFNNGSMVPIPNNKDITDIKAELTEATNVSNKNKQDVSELKESVAGIIKTGVAKLVQYSYDIELSENTKKVNIPYKKYSSVTDTLKVYVNGLAIQNDQYTITDPVENDGIVTNGYIVLKAERPAGTIVRIEVWKNVPSGEEGEVSGNIIAKNSLPLDRIKNIDKLANDNLLLNGDFVINQRKQQTYTENWKYTVDRWLLSNLGSDGTAHGSLTKRDNGISLTGAKSLQLYIQQTLDPIGVSSLYDKTLTLSCEMFGNNITQGNVYIHICYVDSNDQIIVNKKIIDNYELGNNWNKYHISATIPKDVKKVFVQIGTFNDHSSGYELINEDGALFINNVKLEIGDRPTDFYPRLYEEELFLCQRYYEVTDLDDMFVGVKELNGHFLVPYHFKVQKRVIPTITIGNDSYGDNKMYFLTKNRGEEQAPIIQKVDKNHIRIELNIEDNSDSCAFCGWIKVEAEIY